MYIEQGEAVGSLKLPLPAVPPALAITVLGGWREASHCIHLDADIIRRCYRIQLGACMVEDRVTLDCCSALEGIGHGFSSAGLYMTVR